MREDTKGVKSEQSKIEKIKKQFEDWRKNRLKRDRIPEELWEAAIGLYPEYRIYEISQALRLNYSRLKKRILDTPKKESKKESKNLESKIEKVGKKFEEWRKNKTQGRAIPELLWEAAIELHPEHSVCKISQTLRLDYNNLKKRIFKPPEKREPPGAFIQLDIPSPRLSQNEWSIAIENIDGVKIKIDVKSAQMPDLAVIFQNFLMRQG